MEELIVIKGYKELTLYMAVNIVDLYLAKLAERGLPVPPIITLGVVSLLIAVKMNEPISPNFSNMIHLISSKQPGQKMTLKDLSALEKHILTVLDFNLQTETSLAFMERFT